MKGVVVEQPGGPEVLKIRELPIPTPRPGWTLVKIKAFGLNRSEMFTRQGHSPNVHFPRVLGIECVGEVVESPSEVFRKSDTVAAIMGGMGRDFDGSYAQFACLPDQIIFPFQSNLDWEVLGAIPEMFQTVSGSLNFALELRPNEKLLIRGGSSSIGMLTAQIAKHMGAYVISTTRNQSKTSALMENGADDVILDTGEVSMDIKTKYPDGMDKVLELVGTKTILDSMKCCRPKGVVCQTGILGNEWVLSNFEPFIHIPNCVRLTSYGGDFSNLSRESLQEFISLVEKGIINLAVDRVFSIDEIVEAHRYMESNQTKGKLVIVP